MLDFEMDDALPCNANHYDAHHCNAHHSEAHHSEAHHVEANLDALILLVQSGAPVSAASLRLLGFDEFLEPAVGRGGGTRGLRLQMLCERALSNALCAETVVPTLLTAEMYSCDRLAAESGRMIVQQWCELEEAGAFKEADVDGVALLRHILRRASSSSSS